MVHAALICSDDGLFAYCESVLARLRHQTGNLVAVVPAGTWREHVIALKEVEVIFSGWGMVCMDDEFLQSVPRLRAVFYAGGTVRYFMTEAFWRRGIRVTTAQTLNAVPVAEYTASILLLGLKRVWYYARLTRELRAFPRDRPLAGAFGTKLGLISFGTIARLVRERLRTFEGEILVYDPFLSESDAAIAGVRLVPLEILFTVCDAISLHSPNLPETYGMIRGHHFEVMKLGAMFVNTARGEIVNEPEMVAVLQRRPDIQAVLDVSYPEPPSPDSPLYTLPNVVLTPHLAGSVGAECARMGHAMVDEFERYCAKLPLQWEINAARAEVMA